MNKLFFGDNLAVLRQHVPAESVDLVYLDPPFNSNATYNLVHKSPVGNPADSQKRVFKDTWHWEEDAAAHAMEEVRQRDISLFNLLRALQSSLGEGDVMAYLAMMSVRLLELRRVMKPTASLYLHCDPTASHYLKIVLDCVFGGNRFLNEIAWKRHSAHSSAKRYGPVHDTILFYARGDTMIWTSPRQEYAQEYLDKYYKYDDGDGRLYWRNSLTGAGPRNGSSGLPWKGYDPGAKGAHWKFTTEKLDALDADDKIYWPPGGGWPQIKRYRDELKGLAVSDFWDDIDKINPAGNERLGYPTQKPLALLERIIGASSREGDVVLDPFCGCGTTIHAAEKMRRQWIGIDVAYAAIQVIEDRLHTWLPAAKYQVGGIPTAEDEARALAKLDPHTFQEWAVGALGGQSRPKGADRGIDGEIAYLKGRRDYGRAIISVKAGQHVNPGMIRDLIGVVKREGADLGVFVCVNEPTKEMKIEVSRTELVDLPGGRRHRVQIVTAKDLVDGPDIGVPTTLNIVEAAEHARAVARRRTPVAPTPEELRREPPLPPMPIRGGKRAVQTTLPLEEEVPVQPMTRPRGKSRKAS